jgi:hypothetical protein
MDDLKADWMKEIDEVVTENIHPHAHDSGDAEEHEEAANDADDSSHSDNNVTSYVGGAFNMGNDSHNDNIDNSPVSNIDTFAFDNATNVEVMYDPPYVVNTSYDLNNAMNMNCTSVLPQGLGMSKVGFASQDHHATAAFQTYDDGSNGYSHHYYGY